MERLLGVFRQTIEQNSCVPGISNTNASRAWNEIGQRLTGNLSDFKLKNIPNPIKISTSIALPIRNRHVQGVQESLL